jgi:hypothetical protein
MKNSSDTIGNRTSDLPTCSAVPQPTALARASLIWGTWGNVRFEFLTVVLKIQVLQYVALYRLVGSYWRSGGVQWMCSPKFHFIVSVSHCHITCCLLVLHIEIIIGHECLYFFKCVTQSGSSHFCFVSIFSLFCYCTVFFKVELCFMCTHTHTHTHRHRHRHICADRQTKRGNCWLMFVQWR